MTAFMGPAACLAVASGIEGGYTSVGEWTALRCAGWMCTGGCVCERERWAAVPVGTLDPRDSAVGASP